MLKLVQVDFPHYHPIPDLLVNSRQCNFTDHPCFMGDVWNVHDLQLMHGTYASNRRCMECSHFTVDVQGMPALWKMFRTPKTNKAQTKNYYLSAIGINFPTHSPTT